MILLLLALSAEDSFVGSNCLKYNIFNRPDLIEYDHFWMLSFWI